MTTRVLMLIATAFWLSGCAQIGMLRPIAGPTAADISLGLQPPPGIKGVPIAVVTPPPFQYKGEQSLNWRIFSLIPAPKANYYTLQNRDTYPGTPSVGTWKAVSSPRNHAHGLFGLCREKLTEHGFRCASVADPEELEELDYVITFKFLEDKVTVDFWYYFTFNFAVLYHVLIPVPMGAKHLELGVRAEVIRLPSKQVVFSKEYEYADYFTYGAAYPDRNPSWKRSLGGFYGTIITDVGTAVAADAVQP